MKGYIHKYASLSVLDSIEKGILTNLGGGGRTLIESEFNDLIPEALNRRLSRLNRMGVGTALTCAGDHSINGIILGTGIGCIESSLRFLKGIMEFEGGYKSPGTFVQSTHNSTAGQIALTLNSTAYNITHTHRGVAFELALLDALSYSSSYGGSMLVGAADEKVDLLSDFNHDVYPDADWWLGEGSAFFVINQSEKGSLAKISALEIYFNQPSIEFSIQKFLEKNNLTDPDIVLFGNSYCDKEDQYLLNLNTRSINYSNFCGVYSTNSSFGLQLAIEIISKPENAAKFELVAQNILLVNRFDDELHSLIYISLPSLMECKSIK